MMGISIRKLLIILGIVALQFDTKRLRGLGNDEGSAISGFRKAVNEAESSPQALEGEKLKSQQ